MAIAIVPLSIPQQGSDICVAAKFPQGRERRLCTGAGHGNRSGARGEPNRIAQRNSVGNRRTECTAERIARRR
jgi:hypothetical protein